MYLLYSFCSVIESPTMAIREPGASTGEVFAASCAKVPDVIESPSSRKKPRESRANIVSLR